MAEVGGKIRLFVTVDLALGAEVALDRDQGHYLFNVMRLETGASVTIFNGRDGEWRAEVTRTGRQGALAVRAAGQPQRRPPDLTLAFAPIKKARTDFIVEKAVELGAARILPVQTRHTNSERIRQDRLQAHAVEAAEQCGATCVPEVADLIALDKLLAKWPEGRRLYWCDETALGQPANVTPTTGPAAILIGPEGGFDAEEREVIRALPQAVGVSLGPRILRADTAAAAAVSLWMAAAGDW